VVIKKSSFEKSSSSSGVPSELGSAREAEKMALWRDNGS
jgi:hypothetical protein